MFNSNDSFRKALTSKETKKAIPYVMYFGKWYQNVVGSISTIDACVKRSPAWSKQGMLQGFRRVEEISNSNDKFVYRVYSNKEIKNDKTKRDVVIMHFKANNNEKKPSIIIVPGGGYGAVCALAEGFSTAANMNELGYNAFVFNYRVNKKPLMPTPIDDLAAAVRFINNHADEFNVLKDKYIICGFSAGGNLINLFCSSSLGYQKYNLPKPLAAFPIYAGCDFVGDVLTNFDNSIICSKQFGDDYKSLDLNDYVISKHCESFPPSYLVFCSDDRTVPPKSSQLLGDLLKEHNIPVTIEIGEKGDHGFGNGKGTSVEDWPKRAIQFAEQFK